MSPTKQQRIAVIGSGVSGLVASLVLSVKHKVTLFEAADYPGGHVNTIDVPSSAGNVAVDTGFIVYNERTYPNFIELLNWLQVPSKPTSMSFSVSDPLTGVEYASHWRGLLARKRNAVDKRFLGMLMEKFRFDALAKRLLAAEPDQLAGITLGQLLSQHGFSDNFARLYILPMTAAVWSAPLGTARDYPALTLLTFLANHGLLGVNDAPEWRVVEGGSREYVKALLKPLVDVNQAQLRLNTVVQSVQRDAEGVTVMGQTFSEGFTERFDQVVMACHSDQALRLLDEPTEQERQVLGDIDYQPNQALLHTDTSVLPRRNKAWACWNYQLEEGEQTPTTLSYNMNALQGLDTAETYIVTLNQSERIDPAKVIRRIDYAHPMYTPKSVAAQQAWHRISGMAGRTHYCGAYWFYGFHEDGTRSGLRVAEAFGLSLADLHKPALATAA